MTESVELDDYGDAAAMLAIVAVCDCLLASQLDQAKDILVHLDDIVFFRVSEIAGELHQATLLVPQGSPTESAA